MKTFLEFVQALDTAFMEDFKKGKKLPPWLKKDKEDDSDDDKEDDSDDDKEDDKAKKNPFAKKDKEDDKPAKKNPFVKKCKCKGKCNCC